MTPPEVRDQAAALVARTTTAQGIPLYLRDDVVVARVAALFTPNAETHRPARKAA